MTPASKYYMIGIDVGTTHIKAVIFNEWGTEISKSVVGTPSMTDSKYGQVWDPEAMWTKLGNGKVAGSCLSYQGTYNNHLSKALGLLVKADRQSYYKNRTILSK
jgi:glycerol kinase